MTEPFVVNMCRYETDIKLAAGLGATSFRFSFEWARVMPEEPGKVDESAMKRQVVGAGTCLLWISLLCMAKGHRQDAATSKAGSLGVNVRECMWGCQATLDW